MAKILLDYFFPITSITPTPQVATGFLKQVLLVVKPKDSVPTGVITLCTSYAAVQALTNNTEAQQLFNAGKDKIYVMPMTDLDMAAALDGHGEFFTILISGDFSESDMTAVKAFGTVTITSFANLVSGTADTITIGGHVLTAQSGASTPGDSTFQASSTNNATAASLAAQINAHPIINLLVLATVLNAVVTIHALADGDAGESVAVSYTDHDSNIGLTLSNLSSGNLSGAAGMFLGTFLGVVGVSEVDDTFLAAQAAIPNRAPFHTTSGNKAKNMLFAFGSLLSNALDWKNQQYIAMPVADDVVTLGDANILFDDKIGFTISDDEFGNRLGLFACGGEAIVAPYIKRNLELDFQSSALSYISGNQPDYSNTQAALLEDELRKVIQTYIDRQWITAGTVSIILDQGNFVASGEINISEPKALWRIFAEMSQTL